MNDEYLNTERCNTLVRSLSRRGDSGVRRATLAFFALLLTGATVPRDGAEATFEAIRATDAGVARIGYRLATANAPLCDRLEPGLGLVLHTRSQYAAELREAAGRHFSLDGPVGVEFVIADSPAARAGVRADDSLLGIGAVRFAEPDVVAEASTAALIEAVAAITTLPPAQRVDVRGRRSGSSYTRTVEPVPACRARFEVVIGSGFNALADGEMVQISSRFLNEYPEEEVAAVIAHELSHNILRHRERLEARGVSFGMLAGFGRNASYFRQTELEADILSVSLLANAGYDPGGAVRFWRSYGPKHSGGILRSRSHPAWRDRVATIQRAISELESERPSRPALLAIRLRPLSGDWQSLLVKAR